MMADCSRPPHWSQRGLGKNLSSIFGFGNKGPYDDVFVSRPKIRAPAFTPAVKDYAEIFNCSNPSSIPVLELDEFDKREGFGDDINYGNVFGVLAEAQIHDEVFRVGGDGVGKTDGSNAHSRGTGCSTVVEESQKMTLCELSMSSDKITLGGKGETEEINGQLKKSEVPVFTHAFDGTVPSKKVSVSLSSATVNNLKQYSEEAPVGKHSWKVSSGEFSKPDADRFIVIDVGSRNGHGSNKSISSDAQMATNLIRAEVPIAGTTTASNSIMQPGSPVSTSKERAGLKSGMYISNASEGVAKFQNVHCTNKPFTRDYAVDESLARQNVLSSKVTSSSSLTHDHGGGCATMDSDACNSNASEYAKDDHSNSLQDVEFQIINGFRISLISNSPVDASDVRPQESSKSIPATHSQHGACELNTASESDLFQTMAVSRNADIESTDQGSDRHTTYGGKLKEAGSVGPVMKTNIALNFCESISTYSSVTDKHSPSSSDSEIDENSEASVSAATLKKALRKAQACINIAKESHGVKDFTNQAISKKSRKGKLVKEVQKSKAKENQKFFELKQTTCCTAEWSTYSATEMAPADTVDEEVNRQGIEFGVSDKLNQMKDVGAQSSLMTDIDVASTTQHAALSISTSKEKLAVCSRKVNTKLVQGIEDTTMQSTDVNFGQFRDVHGANGSMATSSVGHEALLNNFNESNTVKKITEVERKTQDSMNNSYQGFRIRSFDDDFGQCKFGCSTNNSELKEDLVSETGYTEVHTNQHGAVGGESEGLCIIVSDNSEEVFVSPGEENIESKLNPHDQLSDCKGTDSRAIRGETEGICIPCSDNSQEVSIPLEDENVIESNLSPLDQVSNCKDTDSQTIKHVSEGVCIPYSENSKEVLTCLEEENVTESKLYPHDQVSDCEDTDSQDYASAEENLVSFDTDEEISENYPNFSAPNQLDEIEDAENMVVHSATTIAGNALCPCLNNLDENPVVEKTDENEDMLFQNIVSHEAEVMTEGRTAPVLKYSNEDPIVEETDQSASVLQYKMMTRETKAITEGRTMPVFHHLNEDPIVDEFDTSEDMPMQNTVTLGDKFTSEERTVSLSNEIPIVEEIYVTGGVPILNIMTLTPEEKVTMEMEDGVAPCFNRTNGDSIADPEIEGMTEPELNMVMLESIINLKDDLAPCFDNTNKNMMAEDIAVDTNGESIRNSSDLDREKGATGAAKFCIPKLTSLDIVESESVSRLEAESASRTCHESSHSGGSEVELISTGVLTEESSIDPVEESRSMPWTCEQLKQEVAAANINNLESRTEAGEELHNVASVEAVTEEGHENMDVKVFEKDKVTIDATVLEDATTTFHSEDATVLADATKLESTPLHSEDANHELEVAAANIRNLESRTEASEELHNVARVAVTEEGHENMDVKVFEKDQVTIDATVLEDATTTFHSEPATVLEDATKLESTPLHSAYANHELDVETQFCKSLPDAANKEEVPECEELSEILLEPVERHERKKWDIPRETFELPDLKNEVSEIQGIADHDDFDVDRQMNKHERKKWEIPCENFALPVLGEVTVDNEENLDKDIERVTQLGEKTERKKWKIQKEVFAVPILCSEAVQEALEHEDLLIKSTSEDEMGLEDSSSENVSEVVVPHDEVQNEFSVNEAVVPGKSAASRLCGDNLKEDVVQEWMTKVRIVDEHEPQERLNETSNQRETKVVEGKDVGREECTKGSTDINVKDEIKRTLGMLWKKIYNSKQEEDIESEKLVTKEDVMLEDKTGHVEKDLNLKGPVELVESPRQNDNIQAMNFPGRICGNAKSREEGTHSGPSEGNRSSACNSGVFVSNKEITEEVQNNSTLSFCSSKHQEDEKGGSGEETCKQNYNSHDVESHSEEILSYSSSDGWTEMASIGTGKMKKKGIPVRNILPSGVNECSRVERETVSGLEPLVPQNLVDDAYNIKMVMKVLQQNGSKNTHDDTAYENVSEDEVETHVLDDLSDESCADNEQQDTGSSRQDSKSVSDSEVTDVKSSLKFEQKEDKVVETGPDRIDQACSWKWIFGEDLRDKSEGQDESSEVVLLQKEKAITKEMADEINMNHGTREVKTDGDKPPRMEEKETEGMQKEVKPHQEVLKSEMRAKEIERIAVERAIREARERAFTDARERAAMERANAEAREKAAKERANAEARARITLERGNAEARERATLERAFSDARQKVTANGQEWSQKTSSEAMHEAEKSSMEAKRKAELERAAVDRATAEARQRALEKAMLRKEQISQSSSSRTNSVPIDHYGSSFKDRLNDEKPNESALRFKARNERHQRIAERAAKALEEKNMRDLLIQREQTERNKIAEILDADVNRWARGKTGNLRALLSTLQYILRADSGWQPIHLTEIVTADSVKKAYRKATLFVHPDKLQQRGATIKQKYICEKVFDLLKEAWNRFDRDER